MSATTWCLSQEGSACEATQSMLCPPMRMIFCGLNWKETKLAKLKEVHQLTGDVKVSVDRLTLYPARQYVVPEEKHALALENIKQELEKRLPDLPPLEAQTA